MRDSKISVKEIFDAQQSLFHTNYERWIHDVLFTFNWWFLVALAIISFFLWLKLVNKSRLVEITLVGLFVAIIATILDIIGSSLSLWTYGYQIIQVIPILNPIDLTLLPFLYTLIYQWIPQWKPYILTLILLAAFGAFIAEPIFSWLKIYNLNTWKYIYSFPIYIAIGIGVKVLVEKMISIQIKTRLKESMTLFDSKCT